MANRIRPLVRKWLRDSRLTIAETAKEFRTTWPTVRRWKERPKLEDLPRRPKRNRAVSPFEDALFREFLKLSRYRYQELVQYLRPLQAVIHREIRRNRKNSEGEKSGGKSSQALIGKWHSKTYHLYLYKDRTNSPLKSFDRDKPPRFSVATHSIRVRWRNKAGGIKHGRILLFLERHTGYLYAKVFATRVHTKIFALALFRFNKVLPKYLISVSFVSSYAAKNPDSSTPLVSSVLNLRSTPPASIGKLEEWSPPDGPTQLSEEAMAVLNRQIEWNPPHEVRFWHDAPTSPQKDYLYIPGTYASRTELDRLIQDLVNLINLKRRSYLKWGKRISVAPLDKLRRPISRKSREEAAQHYKLPLKANYEREV